MTRNEYTKHVLSVMRRVTAAERDAIRAELDAHMEDHMEALKELGYDDQLAERRTLERMGDPEEVGRELDKQYPLFWLILERALKVLVCVFAFVLVFDMLTMYSLWDSLRARVDPKSCVPNWEERLDVELDIRLEVGTDILRICGTGTDEEGRFNILYCWYDRNPLGYIANYGVEFYDCRGGRLMGSAGGSHNSRTAFRAWRAYDLHEGFPCEERGSIQPGDTYVTAVVERYDERYEARVPLVWEEAQP